MKKNQMIDIDFQVACSEINLPEKKIWYHWIESCCDYLSLKKDFEITIRIVDATEIQQINQSYRQQNKPTNILSFPFEPMLDNQLKKDYLGDLIIASPVIKQEASDQKKEINDHFAHITIHGFLHLLGYDHIEEKEADRMEAIEISILKQFGIQNPYAS